MSLQTTQHFQFRHPRVLTGVWRPFYCCLASLKSKGSNHFLKPPGSWGISELALLVLCHVSVVPTGAFCPLPTPQFSSGTKRRTFDLLLKVWKLCLQKSRLAFAWSPFHAVSPFPEAVSRECPAEAGWARAGRQAGDARDSLPEFLKIPPTLSSV